MIGLKNFRCNLSGRLINVIRSTLFSCAFTCIELSFYMLHTIQR